MSIDLPPDTQRDTLPAVVLQRLVSQHMSLSSPAAMALGYLRYEAVRKLNPRQFTELHSRNLKGENFDLMVDVLVLANEKAQPRPEQPKA